LAGRVVTGLDEERRGGRSLALLSPREVMGFTIEEKPPAELDEERAQARSIHLQADLFARAVVPYEPCPFRFKYRYRTDDGVREGTCQDWETEATYFNWSRKIGKDAARKEMARVFGEEYPRRGMLLAMGTHSRYPDTWLINGVIRLDPDPQLALL
jgi:hypothetical protein